MQLVPSEQSLCTFFFLQQSFTSSFHRIPRNAPESTSNQRHSTHKNSFLFFIWFCSIKQVYQISRGKVERLSRLLLLNDISVWTWGVSHGGVEACALIQSLGERSSCPGQGDTAADEGWTIVYSWACIAAVPYTGWTFKEVRSLLEVWNYRCGIAKTLVAEELVGLTAWCRNIAQGLC